MTAGGLFIARPGEFPAKAKRASDHQGDVLSNRTSNHSNDPLDAPSTATADSIGNVLETSRRPKGKQAFNPNGPDRTHLITPNLRDYLECPGPSNWADRLVVENAKYPHGTCASELQAQETLRRAAKAEYLHLNDLCNHSEQNCEFVEIATLKERKKAAGGFLGRVWTRLSKLRFSRKKKESKAPMANYGKDLLATRSDGDDKTKDRENNRNEESEDESAEAKNLQIG